MPETTQTRCPNCRATFQVPAGVVGKKIRCKNCQTVFTAAAAGAAPKKASPAKPAKPAKPAEPAGDTFKLADDGPKPGTAKPVNKTPERPPGSPRRPYEEDEDTGPAEYVMNRNPDEDVARCPFCAKELDPPDTLICLNCGFDLLERKRHESKKTYQLTQADYVKHFIPAVVCLIVIGIAVTVSVLAFLYMGSLFEGSFLEMEEKDPNTDKKKYYVPPGVCIVWIIVPSLFICWKCGKFAFVRFFIKNKPQEQMKK